MGSSKYGTTRKNTNRLLTEREGRTGEYCHDRGPIFPSTARASEVSKRFIIWHSVSDSKMQWHSVSDSKMQLQKRFVTESDKSSC